MRLSISSIKLFKACRRAWELKYKYGVIPTQTEESDALNIGSAYHNGIERLYTDNVLPPVVDKESAMVNAYAKYIYPKVPQFTPEMTFEKSVGHGNVLTGRLDGLVRSTNCPTIVEHKTTSLSIEEYLFNLQYDEQLLAYMFATGARMAYYTICKKPTLRQKQTEGLEEFGKRCLEWYDEDTDSKIHVEKIICTDEDVKRFKKELSKMYSEVRTGHYYRNCANCHAYGRTCEYMPICHSFNPNEEYIGFTRKEDIT